MCFYNKVWHRTQSIFAKVFKKYFALKLNRLYVSHFAGDIAPNSPCLHILKIFYTEFIASQTNVQFYERYDQPLWPSVLFAEYVQSEMRYFMWRYCRCADSIICAATWWSCVWALKYTHIVNFMSKRMLAIVYAALARDWTMPIL